MLQEILKCLGLGIAIGFCLIGPAAWLLFF